MTKSKPEPWRAFATLLALSFSAAVAGEDCDCSCEAFQDMQEMMQGLAERADQGDAVMPPTELQNMAACAGECAMAWGRCEGDRPRAGQRHDPDAVEPSRANSANGDAGDANAEGSEAEYALGQPRDDIERFIGLYGSDDQPNRDFFVSEARNSRGEGPEIPPGYLMIGAMWGDVAPWYMKSVGDRRFEQQWTNPGAEALVVEFDTDAEGNAVALRFLSGFLAERGELQRRGDLPEGWH